MTVHRGCSPGGGVCEGQGLPVPTGLGGFLADDTQWWEAGGRLVWSSLKGGGCGGVAQRSC